MNKILLSLGLIVLLCVSAFAQKSPNKEFIGVFRSCMIHCSTYYINADFTFEYTAKGDMYDEERKGTWKYDGNNKIRLFAPEIKSSDEKITIKGSEGTSVETTLPGINKPAIKKTLTIKNGELCTLDKKGVAEFCYQRAEINSNQTVISTEPYSLSRVYQWCPFHCETIKLNADYTFEFLIKGDMFDGQLKGNWKILASGQIRLEARDEQMLKTVKDFEDAHIPFIPAYPAKIDMILTVKKDELCNFDDKGKINFCYKILSAELAEKMFPSKENE